MIFIPKFAEKFAGKKYVVPSSVSSSTEWVAEGFGDNDSNGNPYIVGSTEDKGRTLLRTHLLKNVEFLP